jgi:hypothetical protein
MIQVSEFMRAVEAAWDATLPQHAIGHAQCHMARAA